MGSLRNPVGPLPSSIYWRRRAVLLSILALLSLLIVWIVSSGGGGSKNNSGGSNGKNPAPSITPGPSGSGPAISQAPGGRDESSGGGSSTGGSAGSSGGSEGGSGGGSEGGSEGGSGGSAGSAGSSGSSGSSGDGGSGGGGAVGEQVPAGSSLPECTSSSVQLTLRSLHNSYSPGQKPVFELTAKNVSGSDCKIGLGPEQAVVTITESTDDKTVWASDDCPKSDGSVYFLVPAKAAITHTISWDRKPSAPECGTPPAGSAAADTYLVQAKVPGFTKAQTSFVLAKD
ncbi:hypothetical protein [Streptomyces cavernae]|uniref:hypothetical protein n=1 Tax=Streptomyces cavernae TaxID=2259034 RepID=UPI000FEC1ABF|nr:hypothetical protein [Streptomyces cavernae]